MSSLSTKRLLVVSIVLSFIILVLVALIYFRSSQVPMVSDQPLPQSPSSAAAVSPLPPDVVKGMTPTTAVPPKPLSKEIINKMSVPLKDQGKPISPLPPDVVKGMTPSGY